MDCYLKSIDYDIWYTVMHGDIIPRKKIGDRFVENVHEELDEKDKIMMSKKAKNYLICGLDRNVYNSVDQASSAHEMWKMLKISQQRSTFLCNNTKCLKCIVMRRLDKCLLDLIMSLMIFML